MTDTGGLSRRRVLCGVWTAAALAVGACSVRETPDTSQDPEAPLATVADIEVGGGVANGDVLVVRPDPDTVVAYSRVCPHRRNLVDAPADGVITCPAHGSTFAPADGANLSGPADGVGLTPVEVTVRDGKVFRAN